LRDQRLKPEIVDSEGLACLKRTKSAGPAELICDNPPLPHKNKLESAKLDTSFWPTVSRVFQRVVRVTPHAFNECDATESVARSIQ
jgi:hypothetical protein